MKRALFFIAAILLFVVIALLLTFGFLTNTHTGSRWLLGQIESRSNEQLQVAGIQGRLAGPLTLQGVTVTSKSAVTNIGRIELQWSPTALLRRRLAVSGLAVRDVRVALAAKSDDSKAPSDWQMPSRIDLPLEIEADNISLSNFQLTTSPDAKPLVIDEAQLRLQANAHKVQIESLTVSADLVELTGQLSIDNDNAGALDGDLDWQLRPAGVAAVRGRTVIGGQLRTPRIEQSLDAPYLSRGTVTLDLSQQPPSIAATIKSQTIEVDSIKPGVPPIPLAIDAQIGGVPDRLNIQLAAVANATETIKADLAISALLNKSRLDVSAVSVTSDDIDARLNGSGWLGVRPFGELDLTFDLADVAWPLQGAATVEVPTVTAKIAGTLPTLNVTTELTVRAEPTITVAANGVVKASKEPVADIDLNWTKARWPLNGDALVISDSGKFTIDGSIDNLNITGSAALGTNGRVTATAQRLDKKLDAKLQWTDLGWPLVEVAASTPVVSSPTGTMRFNGLPDDYQLTLSSRLEALENQAADVSVLGSGDKSSFNISKLKLSGDVGNVDGSGNVKWSSPWQVAMNLEGDKVNPGVVTVDWPGDLRISLDASANASNNTAPKHFFEALNTAIKRLTIEGKLRGYPLSVDAHGSLQDGVVEIGKANLRSGQTTAEVTGQVDDAVDLRWRINSPSLKELLPSAQGRLNSDGHLGGTIDQPVVKATLNGSELKYATSAIGAIEIDANWFAADDRQSKLVMNATDGSVAGIAIQSLALSGDGTRTKHKAQLQAETAYGRIDLNATGGLEPASANASPWPWRGALKALKFDYPELAPWQLRSPVAITAAPESVSIERACFDSAGAGVCAVATTEKSSVKADVTLEKLPFDYIKAYLPEATILTGSADGELQFRRDSTGQLSVDTTLNTTAGKFEIGATDESNNASTTLMFEPSKVTAKLLDNKLSAEADLRLVNDNGATISIAVDNPLDGFDNATLSGSVDGRIQDVGVFDSLSDQVSDLQGSVVADMRIAGTVAAPKIEGQLTLTDGGVAIPQIGVDVTDLQVQMRGDPTGDIAVDANALVGDGVAKLNGSISLANAGVRGKLNFSGKDLLVYQTADANIWIDPKLDFALGDKVFGLTGKVTIPRASIKPTTLPESAIAASADQVFVEDPSQKTSQPAVSVNANIDLIMGDDVQIDAFGLRGKLEGEIRIVETKDEPTAATGELRVIDGRYDAYGQTLEIERGRVVFAGGLITQPGIDVRALRRPNEDVTVGVSAVGTLEKPKFTLFSEPTMTQRDQLSYLLLGEASDDLGQGERSAISQAEMALGLKGAQFLADKVGKKFGVDTFAVETEAGSGASTAALMIGKYLSPKLYVSYGLGLFGSTSTLRAQYTLNKNWKISTESSEQGAGGDVIFSIDAGK